MKVFAISTMLILCTTVAAQAYFAEDLNKPTANVITQEKYQEEEARLQRKEAIEEENMQLPQQKIDRDQPPKQEEASEAINERIDEEVSEQVHEPYAE